MSILSGMFLGGTFASSGYSVSAYALSGPLNLKYYLGI